MISRSVILRYGAALLAVAAALGLRLALAPVLGPQTPYSPFALAILVAASFGGRGPGFAATGLSALTVKWFLLEPRHSIWITDPHEAAALLLAILTGAFISLLVGDLRRARETAELSSDGLRRQTQLVDLSHDAIITADAYRRIMAWNTGAAEMYGWSRTEALGKTMHDLLGTISDVSTEEIDAILFREGRWEGDLNHVTRDGSRIRVESRQVLLRGQDNRPAGILEINRDITEKARAEEELWRSQERLAASEERLRLALAAASMGPWDWNIQTGELMWSELCKALFSFRPDAAVTYETFLAAVHSEDRDRIDRSVRDALAGTSEYDVEMRVPQTDGSLRWVASIGRVHFDESGKPVRMTGMARDVTERWRTEKALRESSEQRRLALEGAELGTWEYHPETGEVSRDERGRQMFGFSEASTTYEETIARIHPEDRAAVDGALQNALAGENGGAYDREFRVVWPDGSVHWVSSHGRVYLEGEGGNRRAARLVGVNMNVTERKRSEERLRRAQKAESIGLLAGGIAHDFNNLLTVIMGNASSALADNASSRQLRAILDASERAARLTKQLLAYAGKGQFVRQGFDLTELVSRSAPLLSASVPKRVSLVFNLAKGLPLLEDDPSRIEQILMNLVVNAAEAIAPKTDGRIEIATKSCGITPESARQHSPAFDVHAGSFVCLEVRDNGSGMDEATVSRIFDPFFSTKFTGRGLGLAAVDGVVRSAKGFIEVRSSPGNGSTFQVFLPASAREQTTEAPAKPTLPRQRANGKAATILVVDDEEMVRKLASITLRSQGYEVLEAGDGKQALKLLADSPSTPSLVLLDHAMPVMGGDELIPILQSRYPGLKILLSSGYPEHAAQTFSSPSAIPFLQKPYTAVELAGKVAEALGASPAQPGRNTVQFAPE